MRPGVRDTFGRGIASTLLTRYCNTLSELSIIAGLGPHTLGSHLSNFGAILTTFFFSRPPSWGASAPLSHPCPFTERCLHSSFFFPNRSHLSIPSLYRRKDHDRAHLPLPTECTHMRHAHGSWLLATPPDGTHAHIDNTVVSVSLVSSPALVSLDSSY